MPLVIDHSHRAQPQGTGPSELSQGARGEAVTALQSMLREAGFNPRGVDGLFGPKTRAAVVRFQKAQRLRASGVVSRPTWAALKTAIEAITALRAQPVSGLGPRRIAGPGDAGEHVITLQTLLTRGGFDPGSIDGDFGPATTRAVKMFQRSVHKPADGVAGSDTWSSLQRFAAGAAPASHPPPAGPVSSSAPVATPDVRRQILDIARGEIGTVERTNRNDGAVAKYPNWFGRSTEKYCADFTSWVLHQMGFSMNEAYTPAIEKQLKQHGLWKGLNNPLPGDVVLFDWNDDGVPNHIGFVEKVNASGTITTIEGNTQNPSTGREGVWRRERDMSTVLGFGSPY